MATRQIFHRNAFRLAGLSVNATPREISKQGDKLVLIQELGGGLESANIMGRNPAPSIDELRHALQRSTKKTWYGWIGVVATAFSAALTAIYLGVAVFGHLLRLAN